VCGVLTLSPGSQRGSLLAGLSSDCHAVQIAMQSMSAGCTVLLVLGFLRGLRGGCSRPGLLLGPRCCRSVCRRPNGHKALGFSGPGAVRPTDCQCGCFYGCPQTPVPVPTICGASCLLPPSPDLRRTDASAYVCSLLARGARRSVRVLSVPQEPYYTFYARCFRLNTAVANRCTTYTWCRCMCVSCGGTVC
jgi:hypothetical protein